MIDRLGGRGGCFFQSKLNLVFFSDSFSLICKGLHQTQLQFNETNTCTSQVYSINYKIQTTENTFIYDIEGEIYSYFWRACIQYQPNTTLLIRKLCSLSVCSAILQVCYSKLFWEWFYALKHKADLPLIHIAILEIFSGNIKRINSFFNKETFVEILYSTCM